MEVAQFYYLCRKFAGSRGVSYAPVKAPANRIGSGHEQIAYGKQVLERTLSVSVQLMGIRTNP